MSAKVFDRSRLSARENEVLELAIDGATDQQIALKLDISLSTVNSYWTRIRGKLGHLSRTELVSIALKMEAQQNISRLIEQQDGARRANQEKSELNDWTDRCPAALEAIPEPLFVLGEDGIIEYANQQLQELLLFSADELVGKDLSVIIPKRLHSVVDRALNWGEKDLRLRRLGVDEVFYMRTKDGTELRVILLLGFCSTSDKPLATGIIRAFISEIDTRRRSAESFLKAI